MAPATPARDPVQTLETALSAQQDRLLPCVHCGFCLPACPTYTRLGDEADSPRGRLHLMQAVVDGRLDPGSDAFRTHIDRCLGCRACEPVCPSGVEYGILLEHAREASIAATPPDLLTRGLLAIMESRVLRALFFTGGRVMRATRLAALGARLLPGRGVLGSARRGLAMLAGSVPWRVPRSSRGQPGREAGSSEDAGARRGTRVGVLTGCVQEGLYKRVNDATVRVLEANGFEVVQVSGQSCCGALHAHAGGLGGAKELARENIEAFERAGVDAVVVNAAGCGASMKQYGVLLEDDPAHAETAARFAEKVRDVDELLALVGPRRGAEVRCRVAYDHPCHLLHAQGIRDAPLQVLAAVPGLEVQPVENADECCGGAGIYGITHPDLGGRIGDDKVRAVQAAEADVVATPNPGCMMQIAAGLRLSGSSTGVVHPVELLDESYRRAEYYER
ncbi:MAG: heterodisulfide reductase-related iron-sulfur binding cluster [Gemmatimonadota bacterium]|nr:heterodisulfide reductase-related iron-sulfur binding cluster [Gemmatimonadota bacterium]